MCGLETSGGLEFVPTPPGGQMASETGPGGTGGDAAAFGPGASGTGGGDLEEGPGTGTGDLPPDAARVALPAYR